MAWVRLDDGFAEHPKVLQVGAFGAWVAVQGLCYANRNLTDGFVPFAIAQSFVTRGAVRIDGDAQWTLGETTGHAGYDITDVDWCAVLVDAGIWERAPGGYRIHDYEQYQPSKADVLSLREQRADAGRRGGTRSGLVRRTRANEAETQANTQHVPASSDATEEANSKQTRSKHGSKQRSKNEAKTNPVPVPVPVCRTTTALPTSCSNGRSLALAAVVDDGFDQFWRAYPRKQKKPAARQAWAKLSPAPLDAILAALAVQRRSSQWTRDEGQYIPMPSAYLNQRRWEDEPVEVDDYAGIREWLADATQEKPS